MTIWEYQNKACFEDPIMNSRQCAFCGSDLRQHFHEFDRYPLPLIIRSVIETWSTRPFFVWSKEVYSCEICGWWRATEDRRFSDYDFSSGMSQGNAGVLKELDLYDQSTPLSEIRSYLTGRYHERNEVHPRVMEETVASVFGSLGHNPIVTEYSGDGGIDIFLERGNQIVGVQVKRTTRAIEAEQIRTLTGALVNAGLTKGMFVSTSRFRAGADETANNLLSRGYEIELCDADRLFDALMIAQRNDFDSAEYDLDDMFSDGTEFGVWGLGTCWFDKEVDDFLAGL